MYNSEALTIIQCICAFPKTNNLIVSILPLIEMRYIDIQIEKTLYVPKQLIDPNASPEHIKHHSIILRTLDP
jgi:hypothetical protein